MRTLSPAAKNALHGRRPGNRNGGIRGLFHIDRSTRHRMLMNRQIYLMYLPAILTVIVFNLFTTYGLKIAWLDFNFQDGLNSPSIGWEYFRVLFGMPRFFRLMRNTVEITFLRLLFGFPIVILLALLLNDIRSKGLKNVSQSVLYLPHFLNWVIIATLLYLVFNEHSGVLSRLFGAVGLPYEDITWKREWIRVVLIGSGIWKTMGWSTIIYLAALSAVDPGLYENAIVDGAGKITQMWHISVPAIFPVIAISFVFAITTIFMENLTQILLLGRNMPNVEVFETWIYDWGLLRGNYGMATAMGLFQTMFGIVLSLFANYLVGKIGYEVLW